VTKRIPQPRSELSPGIRAHEAKLLAVMLRTSRLTCVFGEPGTDKTALLKAGVLPLLQRRCADRSEASARSDAGFNGAERRRALPGAPGSRRVEAAIYFDAWGETPLADLKARIEDLAPADARRGAVPGLRLADALQQLNHRSGLHVVFLLDRFEDLLAAPADHAGAAQFTTELVDAILQPRLPASFLIALDESARPRLERLRSRLPGFDHNSLRLSPIAGLSEALPLALRDVVSLAREPGPGIGAPADRPSHPPLAAASQLRRADPALAPRRTDPAPAAPRPRGPPPRVPIKVEEVYAFIEATLAKTSAQHTGTDQPGERGALPKSASVPHRPAVPMPGTAAARPPHHGPPAGPGSVPRPDHVPLVTDEAAAAQGTEGTLPARRRLASALRWLREVKQPGET
jgi:hypothetical protein